MLLGTGSGAGAGPGWHGGASPWGAQSIVFSKVFPKSALSPVSLHPPSFRLCWQRWRDWKPSSIPGVMETVRGAGRSVGISPYKPRETPCSSSGAGLLPHSPLPRFWWVSCTNHPKDCPRGTCVHGGSSSSSSLPPWAPTRMDWEAPMRMGWEEGRCSQHSAGLQRHCLRCPCAVPRADRTHLASDAKW